MPIVKTNVELTQVMTHSPPPIQKEVRAGRIALRDAANVLELAPRLQLRCLRAVQSGKAHSLTDARKKCCGNRTEMSAKTSPYTVLLMVPLQVPMLAETYDLAIDQAERQNPGSHATAVGVRDEPLRRISRCARCRKPLFAEDETKVTERGKQCRECVDGRS